jgi:hypothetical protein
MFDQINLNVTSLVSVCNGVNNIPALPCLVAGGHRTIKFLLSSGFTLCAHRLPVLLVQRAIAVLQSARLVSNLPIVFNFGMHAAVCDD